MALHDAVHAALTQGDGAPLTKFWRLLPPAQVDPVDVEVRPATGVAPLEAFGVPRVLRYHAGLRIKVRAAQQDAIRADAVVDAVRDRMLAIREGTILPVDITVAPYADWESVYGRAAAPETIHRVDLTQSPASLGQDANGRLLTAMFFEIWHLPVGSAV